jgi:uncharacterized protein (DUF952 family)
MTTPMVNPEFIYKIAPKALFDASIAAGKFLGAPIDQQDGYIHFSTASQLGETLRLYFAGQPDLVIFSVRSYDLGAALRWEPSRGGQLFPHVYAELPMSRVVEQGRVDVPPGGIVPLPAFVR